MKKYSYLIIIILISGLVLTGCLLSNVGQVPTTEQSGISYLTKATEGDPFVTTLFAGQDIPVGTVSVWNDGVELHITYNTTGGWVMTETHLAVVTESGDFPTTNKGNPKVGLFPYGEENIFTDTWEEIIGLSAIQAETGETLYIAAHAVVFNETTTELGDNLVANGGFELPIVSIWAVFASGYTGLEWIVEPTTPPWDTGQPQGLELQRIWTPHSGDQYAELDAYDPVRIYQDLSTTSTKGSYTLTYAWSPRPGVSENIMEVWWDGRKIATHSADGSGGIAWTVETYTGLVPNETAITRLEFVETGQHDQLGMFLDSVSVVQEDTESAWADGEKRFTEKGNWATYFAYTVPLHQIEVFAVSSTPVEKVLDIGEYKFVVSGTAFAGGKYTLDIEFDAKCSITHSDSGDTWTDTVSGYESHGKELLDLQVNGISLEWGDCNVDHIYVCSWTGGGVVEFCIKDIYYPNNTGYLTVEIYK